MRPIGVYGICNTAGIAIYEIDQFEDKVLAGLNDSEPEWYDMTPDSEGFMFGETFVPFDEVIRTQIHDSMILGKEGL